MGVGFLPLPCGEFLAGQMAYLVYVGTTGAPWISHIVSDRVATPAELQSGHSEKFALVRAELFPACVCLPFGKSIIL